MANPSTVNPPPQPPSAAAKPHTHLDQNPKSPNPPLSNPAPPPATYVVQLPREQILRYPPLENATKFEALTSRENRRSRRRRCCCFGLCLLFLLIAASAVSAGVLCLVLDFQLPKYTVTDISIEQMNLTSTAPLSPKFNVSIRTENPNGEVGVYYLKDSAVNVFYHGFLLSGGVLPVFYQPKRNATLLRTALTVYDGGELSGAVKTALRNAQNGRKAVNVDAPVYFKVGSAKTCEMTVKVRCDVVVDALNEKAKIVSEDCDRSVKLW
ncbi:hypothetical protein OROGR_002673 [Orobanche gracilis]